MPFYEYQCSSCGEQTEVLQKISDAPLKKCPSCGKAALKRLISAPVFRLKGSGWYETDFKSDQDKKRNLHGADEAPAAKSEEAKPDAKAEAKAEASDKPAATESKPAEKPAPTAARSDSKKPAAAKAAPPAKTVKAKPPVKKKAARR